MPIRELLNQSKTEPGATPTDLSMRLVSIAGTESVAPLWTRPFRRTAGPRTSLTQGLPSRRRTVKLRATAAVVAVGATVTAMVGYGAAPSLAAINDPTSEAQAAFSSSLGQFPLAGDALNAVIGADSNCLTASASAPLQPPAVPSWADPELRGGTGDYAASCSRRSFGQLLGQPIVPGVSRQWRSSVAQVQVDSRAGQGSQVMVNNQTGQQLLKGFTPSVISSRVVDEELLGLLVRNYQLSATHGANVAGRSATLVTAIPDGSYSAAARWWVDDATGIVLWQETYDENGAVDLSYGFTSVSPAQPPGQHPGAFAAPASGPSD